MGVKIILRVFIKLIIDPPLSVLDRKTSGNIFYSGYVTAYCPVFGFCFLLLPVSHVPVDIGVKQLSSKLSHSVFDKQF